MRSSFYESPESLCQIVAEFLSEGLREQQPALVIATPEHRAVILAGLRTHNVDVDRLQAEGDLLMMDASDALAELHGGRHARRGAFHRHRGLCGYVMGHFYKDAGQADIHHQHSHVVSPEGALVAAPRPTVN